MKIDIIQMGFIDRMLRHILLSIEEITGLEFTLTSLYRIGDGGIHETLPLRAVDIRIKHYTIAQPILDFVNQHWIYDPDRPQLKCAMFHNAGKGPHIHLQVHPRSHMVGK